MKNKTSALLSNYARRTQSHQQIITARCGKWSPAVHTAWGSRRSRGERRTRPQGGSSNSSSPQKMLHRGENLIWGGPVRLCGPEGWGASREMPVIRCRKLRVKGGWLSERRRDHSHVYRVQGDSESHCTVAFSGPVL